MPMKVLQPGFALARAPLSDTSVGISGAGQVTRLPLTIQCVPKRSVSMPNAYAQNVFCIGIVIWPPAASASKIRFASAAVG
jgi:hypothetical protein